jgi:hypothetical protein
VLIARAEAQRRPPAQVHYSFDRRRTHRFPDVTEDAKGLALA